MNEERRKIQSLTNYLKKSVIFKECINETKENVEFPQSNVKEVEKNRLSKILPKSTTLLELDTP